MTKGKRILARVLTILMIISLVFPFISEQNVQGKKKKPKLSKSTITVTVKKNKTISVKNTKKAKITWKSKNKKIATVKKSGALKAKIKGVRKGNTKITCSVKSNKKTYKLTCKVKVNAAKKPSTPAPNPTQKPSTPTPTPTPTSQPATPDYSNASLKESYASIFENVGTCLRYNESWRPEGERQFLQDATMMEYVKKHYNSFSLENEMKPNSMIATSWPSQAVTTITKEEAIAAGYVIPANYTESKVAKINFDTLDKVMKIAYDNGIRMRAHTLLWHEQTPKGFFYTDYTGSTYVSPEVMDARMEFFIRTVMKRVCESEYATGKDGKPVVYAWDVVNEYLHAGDAGKETNWIDIYGSGSVSTEASYVKKAFEIAYDVLEEYKLESSVSLFYNDYSTYDVADQIVELINFINSDKKICAGIGMQGHLDTANPTLEFFEQAIDKFIAADFEIQITELDITINYAYGTSKPVGHTNETQAKYMGDLMKMLIQKKKAGANITGITWWGLYDKMSWRSQGAPLLFGKSINDPKPSFYAVIEAAKTFN